MIDENELHKACNQMIQEDLSNKVPDVEHEFSDEFEEKMKPVLLKQKYNKDRTKTVKTLSKVAIIVLIIVAALMAQRFYVGAHGEKVWEHFTGINPDNGMAQFEYNGNGENEYHKIIPENLPEYLKLKNEYQGENSVMMEYDSQYAYFTYNQTQEQKGSSISEYIDYNAEYSKYIIKDDTGIYVYNNGTIVTLEWKYDDYKFFIMCENYDANNIVMTEDDMWEIYDNIISQLKK